MIQRLSIKNFKSWANLENMEFGKVTAVFGPNSSGKTSLIQFLLMLKQTAESRDRRILNLGGTERDYVDLGSYEDVVYGHDVNQKIEFRVQFLEGEGYVLHHILKPRQFRIDISYQATLGYDKKKIYIDKIVLNVSEPINNSFADNMHILSARITRHEKKTLTDLFEISSSDISPPQELQYNTSSFPDIVKSLTVQDAARRIPRIFSSELKNIYYLGPLREYPKREYRWTGEVPQSIGIRGEYAVQAMLSKIQTVEPTEQADLIKNVSKWLKRFGVIDELDLSSISETSRLFELKIKSRNYAHWANLMDVGFGVSQALPVIVLAYFAPPGSIIILEQPEIHLHPSVQAELADLFLEVALTRNVQFFIESHSEHLLMRLQRRIAERSGEFANLTENDVKLYFCKRETDASTLEPLAMDEYGRIKNWPKEFFGDPLGERAAMTKAMLARKMAMNGQNGHKA